MTTDESARWTGGKILAEVEEASLNKILTSLRAKITTILHPPPPVSRPALHHHQHPDPDDGEYYSREYERSPVRPTPAVRKTLPLPGLDALSLHHQKAVGSSPHAPLLSVSGRYLELVYRVVGTVVAKPLGKAVVVVDLEGRFEVLGVVGRMGGLRPQRSGGNGTSEVDEEGVGGDSGARLEKEDLKHLYVIRPPRPPPSCLEDGDQKQQQRQQQQYLNSILESTEKFMLYGDHNSGSREWWGTIVIGSAAGSGSGMGGDVSCGWKGWLRVEREGRMFGVGVGVEEVLRSRGATDTDEGRWVCRSEWGDVRF